MTRVDGEIIQIPITDTFLLQTGLSIGIIIIRIHSNTFNEMNSTCGSVHCLTRPYLTATQIQNHQLLDI